MKKLVKLCKSNKSYAQKINLNRIMFTLNAEETVNPELSQQIKPIQLASASNASRLL